MEESEQNVSISITGHKVIAFRRDEHPLLGIYPPILNHGKTQVVMGLARDGYMLQPEIYDKDTFVQEAKAGVTIVFDHAHDAPPDPVILCVPPSKADLFQGVLDIQHAKNADAYMAVLSLKGSLDQLMRCARKNIPAKDIPHHSDFVSMMIATHVLNDPDRLLFHLRNVRTFLVRDLQAYEDACALARRYLRRFHLPIPKELIPIP